MGLIVYLIHFLPINDGFALILQVLIGATFYLVVSYVVKFEPFVYLICMVNEKVHNKKIKYVLSVLHLDVGGNASKALKNKEE